MSKITKKYWRWDERFNYTPYKLGADIDSLTRKGLIHPSKNEKDAFVGLREKNPQHIEAHSRKISLVYFSFPSGSAFPKIKEGLWEMEEREFITTLNELLGTPCEPTHGDYLFVVFRDFFVTAAAIFRRLPLR